MNNTNKEIKEIHINPFTGEIQREIYDGDSVKVIRDEQKKHISSYKTKFNKGVPFMKMFMNTLPEIGKQLSNAEFATAVKISEFLSYQNGVLEWDDYPADLKTMSEILDINYDVFRRTMSQLIKKDVIRKTTRNYHGKDFSCYVVNPYIYMQGVDLDKRTYELFSDSKWNKNN